MRLAVKLFGLVSIGLFTLLVLDGVLSLYREVRLFDDDMEHDAVHLARAVQEMTSAVWKVEGSQRALDLLDQIDDVEARIRLRWVWLDARPPDPHAPRLPLDRLAPVLAGATHSEKMDGGGGPGLRVTYGPAVRFGGRPGAVELTESLAQLRNYTRGTVVRTLALVVAIGLTGLAGFWLVGNRVVGRPLALLVGKTERIGAGDLTGDLSLGKHDELGTLAAAINQMCGRLQAAHDALVQENEARLATLDQLRHAERLATIGRLSSGLAHELGTPLNVVGGRAALIASGDLAPAEIAGSCEIIRAQTAHMASIIRQLLDFSRRRRGERCPEDLRALVERVLAMLAPTAAAARVDLACRFAVELSAVPVDRAHLEQVLANLIVNAVQAMPHGGSVEVRLDRAWATHPRRVGAIPAEYAVIRVGDDGPGICPEHLDLVFEPFFTTKKVGQGTGLGLSIVREIVEEHGGWVAVESDSRTGTTFSVFLPLGEVD